MSRPNVANYCFSTVAVSKQDECSSQVHNQSHTAKVPTRTLLTAPFVHLTTIVTTCLSWASFSCISSHRQAMSLYLETIRFTSLKHTHLTEYLWAHEHRNRCSCESIFLHRADGVPVWLSPHVLAHTDPQGAPTRAASNVKRCEVGNGQEYGQHGMLHNWSDDSTV